MLEAFYLGRWIASAAEHKTRFDMRNIVEDTRRLIHDQYQSVARQAQATPPMLPSPASSLKTASANSTPNAPHGDATAPTPPGAGASTGSTLNYEAAKFIPRFFFEKPTGPPPPISADDVRVKLSPNQVLNLHELQELTIRARDAGKAANRLLTLPTLARLFPRTFARVLHSALIPEYESDVDMEDDDCELFWPGQAATGEGLGWVCLMGKAMVAEFGAEYGYKGLKGIVPKPGGPLPAPTADVRR
jgi:hypothetical protein